MLNIKMIVRVITDLNNLAQHHQNSFFPGSINYFPFFFAVEKIITKRENWFRDIAVQSVTLGSPLNQKYPATHMQAQRLVCTYSMYTNPHTHTNKQTFLSQLGHLHTFHPLLHLPKHSLLTANCELLRRPVQQKQSGLLNASIHHIAMPTEMRKVI